MIVKKVPASVVFATSALLVIGVAPMPYGYYTLLRLVATVVFAWAAIVSFENKCPVLPYCYGFLVILFNPLIKVSFDKEIWAAIDITAAIFLLATMRSVVQKVGD